MSRAPERRRRGYEKKGDTVNLIGELRERHADAETPFLIDGQRLLYFADVEAATPADLSAVRAGASVALIGDFDAPSILTLLHLIERRCIVVPLTEDTQSEHDYFFEVAGVDWAVQRDGTLRRLRDRRLEHPLLDELRRRAHPGLVLFSSGTTGRPKGVLHDFRTFLERFRTPRPTLRTLNFLLFDHIGGLNTLFHTLYNTGTVVVPSARTPDAVLDDVARHRIELLPTTPTFLRMLLMSGLLERGVPETLKLVTYGTERMDQGTLDQLCSLMPGVDFRQTYGLSELGIMRVKSYARDSLWMKVGGEDVETRVTADAVLEIRSAKRMLGYLNAESPFDADGWYNTKDLVDTDGEWIRIVGRQSEVISVGGLKLLPGEVERVALEHPDVVHADARGVENPITGQHIELTVQLREGATADKPALRRFFRGRLPEPKRPHRIRLGRVAVGHRFKRA